MKHLPHENLSLQESSLSYPLKKRRRVNESISSESYDRLSVEETMQHNWNVIHTVQSFVDPLTLFFCRCVSKTWLSVSQIQWRYQFYHVMNLLNYNFHVSENINVLPTKETCVSEKKKKLHNNNNNNNNFNNNNNENNDYLTSITLNKTETNEQINSSKIERNWFHLFMSNFCHYIKGQRNYNHLVSIFQHIDSDDLNDNNNIEENIQNNNELNLDRNLLLKCFNVTLQFLKLQTQYADFRESLDYMPQGLAKIPTTLFYPLEEQFFEYESGTDGNIFGVKRKQQLFLSNVNDPFKQVIINCSANVNYCHAESGSFSSLDIKYRCYDFNDKFDDEDSGINNKQEEEEEEENEKEEKEWNTLCCSVQDIFDLNQEQDQQKILLKIVSYSPGNIENFLSTVDIHAEKHIMDYLDIPEIDLSSHSNDSNSSTVSKTVITRFILTCIVPNLFLFIPTSILRHKWRAQPLHSVLRSLNLSHTPKEISSRIDQLENVMLSMACEFYSLDIKDQYSSLLQNQRVDNNFMYSGGDVDWIDECSNREKKEISQLVDTLQVLYYGAVSGETLGIIRGISTHLRVIFQLRGRDRSPVKMTVIFSFSSRNEDELSIDIPEIKFSLFEFITQSPIKVKPSKTNIKPILSKLGVEHLKPEHFIDLIFTMASISQVLRRNKIKRGLVDRIIDTERILSFKPRFQTSYPRKK